MERSKQPEQVNQETGPLDDLKVVNKLSAEMPGHEVHTETRSPSADSDHIARVDLSKASLEMTDAPECRSVPLAELSAYLFLARERQVQKERQREEFWKEELGRELGLNSDITNAESSAVSDGSTLVQPETIRKLLALYEISHEDWQEVTASADIPDLLRAARSVEAIKLALPKNATGEQIAVRKKDIEGDLHLHEQLAYLDVIKTISEKLNSIRSNAAAHTSMLNADGSVELGRFSLALHPSSHIGKLPREEYRPWYDDNPLDGFLGSLASRAGALVGAVVPTVAATALAYVNGNAHDLVLAIMGGPVGFLGGGILGVVIGDSIADLYYKKVRLPMAKQQLLAEVRSSPSLEKVLKELELKGVQCEATLGDHKDDQPCLNLRLYIPKKR